MEVAKLCVEYKKPHICLVGCVTGEPVAPINAISIQNRPMTKQEVSFMVQKVNFESMDNAADLLAFTAGQMALP